MIHIDFDKVPTLKHESITFEPASYPATIPLRPRGYETPDVEAMSSYLCRLAENASETTFPYARRLLRRYLRTKGQPKNLIYPNHAHAVNGFRTFATRLATAISVVSQGAINGESLTAAGFRNISDDLGRRLLKMHREWCHECWREDILKQDTPYIRLYWLIRSVNICCRHKIKLQQFCAKCGAQQEILPTLPRQWICDHCGFVLYHLGKNHIARPSESWVSHSVYRLMERIYEKKYTATPQAISNAIQRLMLSNKETYSSLFKKLNIPKPILEDAGLGIRRPLFPALAELCYRIDVPIDQFVFDRDVLSVPETWRALGPAHFVSKENISEVKKQKIGHELQTILKENPQPPPRISHIARDHGLDYTVLEYHFRRETNEIRRRWLVWNSAKNLKAARERMENLLNGVIDLVRNNVYPSDRKLRDLGYVLPSDLRRDELVMVLRSLQDSYKLVGLFDGVIC